MQTTTSSEVKGTSAWRSPWVIGWVGLVVVVLGVNLTMVVLAIATNPGLVNDDFYERGQDYERTLCRPGPGSGLDPEGRLPLGHQIRGAGGGPVLSGRPCRTAGHPGQRRALRLSPLGQGPDFSQPMVAEGKGRYTAELSFPLIGVWDTLVAIREGGEEYTVGQRIHVQRP
jgi:nitrogen fixation protein FixH